MTEEYIIAEGILQDKKHHRKAKIEIEFYVAVHNGGKTNRYYKLHFSGKELASFIRQCGINKLFTFFTDHEDGRCYGYIILSEKGLKIILKKLEKWFEWIEKPDIETKLFLTKLRWSG